MSKEQTITETPHATCECVAELINLIDTSSTSRKLMQRMDHFLDENLVPLKKTESYAHFLQSLRDTLHKHDIPSEKLKTIHYHLLAIECAEKVKHLEIFGENFFMTELKTSLLKNHCITTYDQLWVLNKIIFYINTEAFTHNATMEALKALEHYKITIKETSVEGPHTTSRTKSFIDRWALIYDEVITIFRLR